MKKATRRILSLIFSLVLVCSLAVPAFAADSTSLTWNDGEYLNVMTITLNSTYTRTVPFNKATIVTWNGGNPAELSYTTSDTATCYASYSSALNEYTNYLGRGLDTLGCNMTMIGECGYNGTVFFNAFTNYEYGTYKYGLNFTCRSGSVSITRSTTGIIPLAAVPNVNGTVSSSPESYDSYPILMGP